jgi:hypothetical protein
MTIHEADLLVSCIVHLLAVFSYFQHARRRIEVNGVLG